MPGARDRWRRREKARKNERMPVQVDVDHAKRLIRFTVLGRVSLEELVTPFDPLIMQGLMPYAKLFDVRDGKLAFSDQDVMALGARAKAYEALEPRGPVALVAGGTDNLDVLWRFMNLARGKRSLALFDRLSEAERWLTLPEISGAR